jgi:signal transduction histidine kinase
LQCVVQPFRGPAGHIHGVVGVALDITDRKRVEGELAEKREELQALSRRLLAAQEAERRALARELHDDFGQFLTAIRLNLEAMRRGTSGDVARQLVDSLTLVDQAVDRVRSLALELRPAMLDDLGLVPALRWLVKRQSERAGFEGRLRVGRLGASVQPALATCSFRLVQEALTNAARHAGASSVDVELSSADGELRIVVRDDGKGFDVAAARQLAARGMSLGLLSMQERVTLARGRLTIESSIGKGTTIDAHVPLAAEDAP